MNEMAKKKILIIQNIDKKRGELELYLSNYPYNIYTTSNGNHGIELAKQNIPDIILASTQLVDIDCIDLCWMIRQTPELSRIPYILLAQHLSTEEKINSYRSGVDAILNNNITIREIHTRIEAILKRYHQFINSNNSIVDKSLQGKLSHFSVVEILQMLNISKKSGTLKVSLKNKNGEIGFWEGKLVWAKQHKLLGEKAVKEITSWSSGYFTFEKDLIHPIVNIHIPTMQVILNCCKILDEQKQPS